MLLAHKHGYSMVNTSHRRLKRKKKKRKRGGGGNKDREMSLRVDPRSDRRDKARRSEKNGRRAEKEEVARPLAPVTPREAGATQRPGLP